MEFKSKFKNDSDIQIRKWNFANVQSDLKMKLWIFVASTLADSSVTCNAVIIQTGGWNSFRNNYFFR
jgi:hypothetical protein